MPKSKKAAAQSAKDAKSAKPYSKKSKADPMFPARARSFRIGQDVLPTARDVSRYVKWPRYVRIQRQRKILLQRLKVPPSINQFSSTLNKSQATEMFKLFNNYRPETKQAKQQRLKDQAAAGDTKGSKPGPVIKFGLNHVTTLIEEKKAKLVLIANDVDPLELVVWLPALCKKMDVPYAIVKNKARLGALVHMKTAAAVCLTNVEKADDSAFRKLQDMSRAAFNDNAETLRQWGGGIMGLRTQAKLEKREKMLAAEAAKKAKVMG